MTEEQENIINEFNLYLEKIKQIGRKARGNYLSWARYLSKTYDLAAICTEEDVVDILGKEWLLSWVRCLYNEEK